MKKEIEAIKATELRIGNWLYFNGNHRLQVNKIDIVNINSGFEGYDGVSYVKLSGIPITPEILEKAGFEKLNNGWIIDDGSRDDYGNKISGDETFTLFDYSFGQCKDLRYNGTHITYLHQLQNLYFALTNKELIINL